MPLNPYFHGTTSRNGAPFWFNSVSPYRPTASIASGCIASSSRNPSLYGHGSSRGKADRWPTISCGRYTLVNSTYLADEDGSNRLRQSPRENPSHGITIDQPSTQRIRYTRSSMACGFRKSSRAYVPGLLQRPSTATDHGLGLNDAELRAGPLLSAPNS